MKKLLLIVSLILFSVIYSQTKSTDYGNEIKNLQTYIENAYQNDSDKIKSYVKNESNGKIFLIKTDDIYSEFDFEFYYAYDFLRKDDKLVYTRKMPISQSGDSAIFYDYYFNNGGRLIGAEKNVSSFYGENQVVFYKIKYELNDKTDKLEKISEIYTDEKGKKIEQGSKLYKEAVENGLISSYIEDLDKITFRDLEGFMKSEKIKYYTDNDSQNVEKKEQEKRIAQSNNLRLFDKENLKKFTLVEKYMDSLEINKISNDDIYIEIEPSKKIVKIKREKLAKKRYKTMFDLYGIGQYSCIREIPNLDNGLFMKLNRFYDETGQFFSFTEIEGVVNDKGEKLSRVSRFCLLKNNKSNYDSEERKMGLVSRKYYKNETEISNDEFNSTTKNLEIYSYSERFGEIDRNVLSDYQNQRDEKNKKINKYSTVGMQTLLNLIVK